MKPNSQSESDAITGQVFSALKWSYISIIFQALCRVAILSILAQLLSPSDFGLLSVALIFTSFAERVGQVGVGPSLVQRAELPEEYIRTGTFLSLATGLLIFLVLYLVAPSVAVFFDDPKVAPVLRAVSTIFLIEGIAVVPDCMLQRQLKFKAIMSVENISYLIGSGFLGIALAYSGFGVWSLVLGLIAARLLKLLMLLRYVPLNLQISCSPRAAKELLTTGAGFSLGRVLSFGALQGDNFVVGKLLGVEALGLYSRSYQLMTLPATYFGNVLERVLFPAMAKKQKDTKSLVRIFLYSIELVSLIALPASVFMFLTSHEIIFTLFGDKWESAVPVLQILSLGVFFRTGYKSSDTLMRSLGAVYKHASRQFIYTLFVIVGATIGSRYNGLQGVAYAVLLAVIVNYLLMTHLSYTALKIPFSTFLKAHFSGLWISLMLAIVLIPTLPLLREEFSLNVVVLIIAAALSGVVGLIALLVSPPFCKLHSLRWILGKLNPKKLEARGNLIGKFLNKVAA